MAKATKAKANYRDGTAERHCGICDMFRPPNRCTAVKGKIDTAKLCDYFERKKRIPNRGERWYGKQGSDHVVATASSVSA